MELKSSSNIVLQNDSGGRGRLFRANFMEAGLVSYDDGIFNVTNEAIQSFCQTLIGIPVTIKHSEVTDDNADDLRVGVVSSVGFDNASGWFYCEGIIWDNQAIELVEKGWSVSCTYQVLETTGQGGERNNIAFDDELVTGKFLHLALVPNPRYEKASITLFNSKGKVAKMFKNIFNSKKLKQNGDEEMSKKENEDVVDKNALKNRIMEHVNKAVKGQEEIDGQSEDSWYEEFRKMLDKLAYSESEDEKSNEKDESDEDEKENACEDKENADAEDKKESEKDDDESKENEDKEEEKKETKENSKLGKLHNSAKSELVTGYESEKARLARGVELF